MRASEDGRHASLRVAGLRSQCASSLSMPVILDHLRCVATWSSSPSILRFACTLSCNSLRTLIIADTAVTGLSEVSSVLSSCRMITGVELFQDAKWNSSWCEARPHRG